MLLRTSRSSSNFSRGSLLRGGLLLAAAAPVALLSGCSNMATTASNVGSVSPTAAISGQIHGGRQPIVNSHVTLWAAGNAGYGSAATNLASTYTDGSGNFTLTGGVCPAAGSTTASQSLYLTASGGQTAPSTTNNSAAFLLALGDCSTVLATNPVVNINEVTTVASIFALQQFFTPDTTNGLGSIGTSATNLTGLKNAMATVNNLVDINAGTAKQSLTASGAVTGYTTSPTVTITPEYQKINTLANILANCVNSDGGSDGTCPTLFADVNTTAAKDTLQAAYYLATNPTSTVSGTSNLGTIYTLPSAESPFGPALSAPPTDWTLGVEYSSSSKSDAALAFYNEPEFIAVDGTGNIWAVNYGSHSASELSPTGTPLTQVLTTLSTPEGIAIDQTGNVWVPSYGSSSGSTLEYTTSGATNTFPTNKGPEKVAIDGQGNVFVVEPNYKTVGTGILEEIPANSASGTTATTLATGLTLDYSNLAIDGNYNIWLTMGATSASSNGVYQFLYSSASTPNYAATPTLTVAGGINNAEPIAVDGSNNIWVANYQQTSLSELAATNSSTINGATGSPFTTTGLTYPESMAIDGNGNVWLADAVSKAGALFEYSSAGTSLSPSGGFTHSPFFYESYGIALDASGNIWVGNYSGSNITEVVGAAAPVKTPLAAGLPTTPGGPSQLGVRP